LELARSTSFSQQLLPHSFNNSPFSQQLSLCHHSLTFQPQFHSQKPLSSSLTLSTYNHPIQCFATLSCLRTSSSLLASRSISTLSAKATQCPSSTTLLPSPRQLSHLPNYQPPSIRRLTTSFPKSPFPCNKQPTVNNKSYLNKKCLSPNNRWRKCPLGPIKASKNNVVQLLLMLNLPTFLCWCQLSGNIQSDKIWLKNLNRYKDSRAPSRIMRNHRERGAGHLECPLR
jgi:hypothetical protein